MKVLHITYWYPSSEDIYQAIWIKRQIDALSYFLPDYKILHLQVQPGKSFSISRNKNDVLIQRIINVPIDSWILIELLSFIFLVYYLIKLKVNKNYDVLNFHIAYPLLTYWHIIKRFFDKPVVITEHWSAYRYNFGVKKELPRIKRIFSNNLPVITVSESLGRDIELFAGCTIRKYIVPNIVSNKYFYKNDAIERMDQFFMIGLWKEPKNAIPAFQGFLDFNITQGCRFKLLVGGYGPDYEKMLEWKYDNDKDDAIIFLGKLNPSQIADYLRSSKAVLHPSKYETFSVICAEAVSCGTPVVAPSVGGIPEVVGPQGILLDDCDDPVQWSRGLAEVLAHSFVFDFDLKYSPETVGNKYAIILREIHNDIRE